MTEKRKVLRWRKGSRQKWIFTDEGRGWDLMYGDDRVGGVSAVYKTPYNQTGLIGFMWVTPANEVLGIAYRNSYNERRIFKPDLADAAKAECEAYVRECLKGAQG